MTLVKRDQEGEEYDPTKGIPMTRDSADSSDCKQVMYWQAEYPDSCWALQGGNGKHAWCPSNPTTDIGLCEVHYEEIFGPEGKEDE